MFEIYDGRLYFYQWDSDQRLIMNELDIGCKVHFINDAVEEALTVLVYESADGEHICDVPNILLTSEDNIKVYAYIEDSQGNRTVKEKTITVKRRGKPSEYIYTETEVVSYKALEDRVNALEDMGGVSVLVKQEIDAHKEDPDAHGITDMLNDNYYTKDEVNERLNDLGDSGITPDISDLRESINEEIAAREEADEELALAIQNVSKIYVVSELPTEDIDENGLYIETELANNEEGGFGGSVGGVGGPYANNEIVESATVYVRNNGNWVRTGIIKDTIYNAINFVKDQLQQSIGSVSSSVLTLDRMIRGDGDTLETNADTLIGAINELNNKDLKLHIVTELPTEDVDRNGLYILVPIGPVTGASGLVSDCTQLYVYNDESEGLITIGVTPNMINEALGHYYRREGGWGGTGDGGAGSGGGSSVDLSDYYTKTETDELIALETTSREEADRVMDGNIGRLLEWVGDLSNLKTDVDHSLVPAINELHDEIDSHMDVIGELDARVLTKSDKTIILTSENTIYIFEFSNTYNTEIRLSEVSSISFTFGDGEYTEDYMSGLSFDSGETPTSIDYTDSGILNWVGTDCSISDGLSIFQPSANTHYDIVFYFNGRQFIGLVNGFVPSVGNVVSE